MHLSIWSLLVLITCKLGTVSSLQCIGASGVSQYLLHASQEQYHHCNALEHLESPGTYYMQVRNSIITAMHWNIWSLLVLITCKLGTVSSLQCIGTSGVSQYLLHASQEQYHHCNALEHLESPGTYYMQVRNSIITAMHWSIWSLLVLITCKLGTVSSLQCIGTSGVSWYLLHASQEQYHHCNALEHLESPGTYYMQVRNSIITAMHWNIWSLLVLITCKLGTVSSLQCIGASGVSWYLLHASQEQYHHCNALEHLESPGTYYMQVRNSIITAMHWSIWSLLVLITCKLGTVSSLQCIGTSGVSWYLLHASQEKYHHCNALEHLESPGTYYMQVRNSIITAMHWNIWSLLVLITCKLGTVSSLQCIGTSGVSWYLLHASQEQYHHCNALEHLESPGTYYMQVRNSIITAMHWSIWSLLVLITCKLGTVSSLQCIGASGVSWYLLHASQEQYHDCNALEHLESPGTYYMQVRNSIITAMHWSIWSLLVLITCKLGTVSSLQCIGASGVSWYLLHASQEQYHHCNALEHLESPGTYYMQVRNSIITAMHWSIWSLLVLITCKLGTVSSLQCIGTSGVSWYLLICKLCVGKVREARTDPKINYNTPSIFCFYFAGLLTLLVSSCLCEFEPRYCTSFLLFSLLFDVLASAILKQCTL